MALPTDYEERVYAGVLGKIIGVYLGRPFEGWRYERIQDRLGEVWYYVNDRLGVPLIVTDDDISGTFVFVRALPDYGNQIGITARQIGETWLNYIIERRTTLWWGGMGNSTEHTAYLRLKSGTPAPESGAAATNSRVVAEQIGAQIFIDGWAMVAPGDPELAADLAGRAARVSHDGEAVYGAQVIAAMESLAFVEKDLNTLIDTAVTLIPKDSVIFGLIDDIRTWHATDGDWRATRDRIAHKYGYDTYGGNCHIVPNHGLIIHALLYGDDDFQKSLMIVNTCGWDTDCNSGNVGCLLGIKNGLPGIDAGPDWRGPVADRVYLSSADGGSAITDAVTEAAKVAAVGRALVGEGAVVPKAGARFHFEMPGSVQGFHTEDAGTWVENADGHSASGTRSLAVRYRHLAPGTVARATTSTFIPPEAREMRPYYLLASPTLYPGQRVRARVEADGANSAAVGCRLFLRAYGPEDEIVPTVGPAVRLDAGQQHEFDWRIPDLGGQPIAQIGVELTSDQPTAGSVYLDYLTWDGTPEVMLGRPEDGGEMWRRAWVAAVDRFDGFWPEPYRLVQNSGTGLLIQGGRDWTDYELETTITPHMVATFGVAVRVQGLRRYYALLLARDGKAQLVRELDGTTTLAETDLAWSFGQTYTFRVSTTANRIRASINGEALFDIPTEDEHLTTGAVALICHEGRIASEHVHLRPRTERPQ